MNNDFLILKSKHKKYLIYINNLNEYKIKHNKHTLKEYKNLSIKHKKQILLRFLKLNGNKMSVIEYYNKKYEYSYSSYFFNEILDDFYNLHLGSYITQFFNSKIALDWVNLLTSINYLK